MTTLLPNRFLFDFEFPLRYCADTPPLDGAVEGWRDEDRLPLLGVLEDRRQFAEVWACWNEAGLYLACRVTGKRRRLRCDPKSYWAGDNLRICTDMRDARTAHRASRYCQQFFFMPTGGGKQGKEPVGQSVKIRQTREDAPVVPDGRIAVAAEVVKGGYSLTGHIPADCLSGFNPRDHPRIGFYYIVEDDDFGQQYLTAGDELGWFTDPSTWATAVLSR